MKNFKNCFFFISSLLLTLNLSAQNTALKSATTEKKIIFLGDSLTEGYGVDITSTYTHLLQDKITKENLNWKVVNAGISGSTTASAKGRISWILKDKLKPSLVVIILGANDGLRGHKIPSIKKNLKESIELVKNEKIEVILGEVWVPPNYGKEYSEDFKKMFAELAKESKVTLMPFLLKEVAGKPDLNLADGIHPNEKGHQVVYEQVFNFIKPYLK
jgi:acyl-CoA thioesterase-1